MANITLYNGLRKFKSAYLKSAIDEKDLKKFIEQLFSYYKEVSFHKDKSEEYLKNITNDFLKNSFYFDNSYKVNVQDKIDSAILKNNKVQVLLEFKHPNSNEMLKQENINKKALHEAVLYYISERQNNDELKYTIITDTINWFVFNAHDFEHIFYSKLNKKYEEFKAGKLVDINNPFFYNLIQEYFKDKQKSLDYTYFNLDDILKNSSTKNIDAILQDLAIYKEIKYLYKFFNPNFLLKEYSQKDTNSLNKGFYNELLYLMGLKEIKESGKLLIVRDKELEGSLLNSTYRKLIDDKDLPNNEKTESIALELLLTWINRILFIKLFESQLILFNTNTETPNCYEIINSKFAMFYLNTIRRHRIKYYFYPDDLKTNAC